MQEIPTAVVNNYYLDLYNKIAPLNRRNKDGS